MRTMVYVDGFNLYYAVLRKTPYKWLDLVRLFRHYVLQPDAEIVQVRYYTAPVKTSSSDDPGSQPRQQRYHQALLAHGGERIAIVNGFIARSTRVLRRADLATGDPNAGKVRVYQFTEKQTDVNLTADLISDAWRARFEQAVICSNDSDLVGAIAAVRRDHPSLRVGVVAPTRSLDARLINGALRKHAHWCKALSVAHLKSAQLPERIPGTSLTCPAKWRACSSL